MNFHRLYKITGCLFVCLSLILTALPVNAAGISDENLSSSASFTSDSVNKTAISEDAASDDSEVSYGAASGKTSTSDTLTDDISSEGIVAESTVSDDTVSENTATDSTATDSTVTDNTATDSTVTESSVSEAASTSPTSTSSTSSSASTSPAAVAEAGGLSGSELYTASSNTELTAGYYEIVSKNDNNKAVTVRDSSTENGANVEIGTCAESDSSLWYVMPLGDGLYSFKNAASGRMLDIYSGSSNSGTNVWQYTSNNSAAQKWTINLQSDGYCTLTASYCNLVLDLYGGQTSDGVNIWAYRSNNTNAQHWKFIKRTRTVKDGVYTIGPSFSANRVLDIAAGSPDNEANAQIYQSNGTAAQKFVVQSAGDGYCYILSQNTRMALDICCNQTANGTNVRQYVLNNSDAQKWKISDSGDGTYSIVSASGKFLDVYAGQDINGANVQIWSGNGTAAQQWRFTAVSPSAPAEEMFRIVSTLDQSKVIDVSDGVWKNGTNIQLCLSVNNANTVNQQFNLTKESDGYYSICNVATGKMLDVYASLAEKGTNVWLYGYNGSNAQKWKFVPTGDADGSYYIVSALGLYLDIAGAGTATGTNVQIYTGNQTKAQKFYLVKTGFNGNGWNTTRSQARSYYTNGVRSTGWKKIGIPYYCFNSDGVLVCNSTVDGFNVDGYGRKGLNTGISNVPSGGRTVRNLLQNAMKPCGRTLYIWGGGWGDDSQKIGYLSSWNDFFMSHATSTYNRHDYEYSYWSGLDCSGYVSWAIYNALFTEDNEYNLLYSNGTYYNSSLIAGHLSDLGWTSLSKSSSVSAFKPGDIVSKDGHVIIIIGTCSDGSAVFIHSSPANGTYGGGVQISGTTDRNGNADSEGYRLAETYMNRYFFEWPYGTACVSQNYILTYVNKGTWITSGKGIMTDPDGLQNKSAAEVLKSIFSE